MPKPGYPKDIISVSRNIGSSFIVMPAPPVWPVFFGADNHRVSHEGSLKPLSVSSHLHVSQDHFIIHDQYSSVALFSVDYSWEIVIVKDPYRASSLLTSSKENRIAQRSMDR